MTDLDRLFEAAWFNEMTNLRPSQTGLPMTIYVSDKDKLRHGPRVKIFDKYGDSTGSQKGSPMTIEKEPKLQAPLKNIKSKDVNRVSQWITLNRDALLAYYHKEITTKQFLEKVKKV